MAKERTIQICGLNIAMHSPHSPEKYLELIRSAKRSNYKYKQGELHWLMFGPLIELSEQERRAGLLIGYIYRFVGIDAKEPWFNVQESRPATDSEVDEINIPTHLRAHLQQIPYVFNSKKHELWYVAKDVKASLGPRYAEKFAQTILSRAAAKLQFSEVEVTSIPSETSLDKIFSIHRLTHLIIDLKRPNPDDGAKATKRILARMEAQFARRTTIEHVAVAHGSFTPDAETKELARVAASNGSVTGYGKDVEGIPVKETTIDKPMRIFERVDPDIDTATSVLTRVARN